MAERRGVRLGRPLLLGLALAAAGLGLAAGRARADVAPIPQVGENGHSLGPAAATSVQMVSETVVLEMAESLVFTSAENEFETERPGALVTADFLLRNPDSAAQRLTVGFPMVVPPAFDPNSFGEA
ncbi:MAG: hypothetical protein JNK29_13500, partial [Anaerolineales bacterium]|nr:hypothetical protein [Anaerolineales bacterium]